MIYLGQNAVGIALWEKPENVDTWIKPQEWPNIEALTLPSENVSCMYFLYDCRTEVRYGGFRHTPNKADLLIAKYENGVIGEFSNATKVSVSQSNTVIPLPDDCDYAILKLQGEYTQWCFNNSSDYGFSCYQNNTESNQPCLWYYGKVYSATDIDLYQNQTGGIATNMLKRVKMYLSPTVILGYGINSFGVESLVLNDGDFNGGKYPFVNSSAAFNAPIVKCLNSIITRTDTPRIGYSQIARMVDFSGLQAGNNSISMQQLFQYNGVLENFKMHTNGLKISSLYYTFSGCHSLKTIDMTGCDLSECTASVATTEAFTNCRNLTTLKLGSNIKKSLNLEHCTSLTHDTLVNDVIANLAEVETQQTLKLNNIIRNKLSAAEIAVATNKGWQVT